MMLLRCLIPFAVVCLSLTLPSVAQEKTFGRRIAELVAPLDAQESVFVVHIDLAKVDASAVTDWAVKASLDDREGVEAAGKKFQEMTAKLKAAGAREINVVVYAPGHSSPSHVPVDLAAIIATGPGTAKAVADAVRPLLPEQLYAAQERGDAVIVALSDRLKSLTLDAKPSEAIAAAFDASKPAPVRGIALLPGDLRRVVRETFPRLPSEFGKLSGSDIADGIRWATLSVDLPPSLEFNLEVQTTGGEIPRSLAQWVDVGIKRLSKMAANSPELAENKGIWDKITPRIEGDKISISIGGKPGEREAFQSAVTKSFSAFRRREMQVEHVNRLKQFGLAMHNFENAKGRLPARAIPDAAGKPLLSWRVEILPYIGHAELYSQFKLNEPWDSENNKKLIEKMPPEFVSPLITIKEKGKTPFVVPIAERSMFSGKEGVRFFDITDGTANTIMLAVADAKHAVVWTKPDDLAIDPKDPTSGLHFNAYDGRKVIYFAIADGSVVGIPRDQLVDKLLPLLTIDGGEVASF